MFCELGNQVTQRYQDLAVSVYDLDWYMLPVHLQQYFPMILCLAQKNVYLQGFGNANCTLEVFKKVFFSQLNFKVIKRRKILYTFRLFSDYQYSVLLFHGFTALKGL